MRGLQAKESRDFKLHVSASETVTLSIAQQEIEEGAGDGTGWNRNSVLALS